MRTKINTVFERQSMLKETQKTIDAAKAASRDLTKAEDDELTENMRLVKAFDASRDESAKAFDAWCAVAGGGIGQPWDDDRVGLFTDSEKASFVHAVRSKTGFATTVPLTSARLKAPMGSGPLGLPGVGTQVVAAANPLGAYALRDLFEPATAESPVVRWYTLANPAATAAAIAADPAATAVAIVPEGGIKPEAEVVYAPVDSELVKLATRFTITDELREDASFLLQEIQASVLRAVLARENQLIVDTIAATSGILTGTGAAGTLLDILATEIGAAEAINGETPTGLLLNPTNLAAVRIAKASTGGSYYLDPTLAGPSSLHGVPLISSAAVAAGTAYLVTRGFGTFYSRSGLRVEAGTSGDDFVYNRISIRAEERVLPVVNRPSSVTRVTLT